jgi:hypothetical protein
MCSGVQIYQEDLDEHYKTSPMHALCTVCDVGFEDKEALDQVRQEVPTLRKYKLTLLPVLWIAAH